METHVKTVPLGMELDFHERLLNTVGKSISMTKKRLHDAELVLNLRPPDDETEEIKLWNAKVAALIERREPLEFPTLYKVKKEYDSNALVKSIMTGRQRIESREIYNQRMNRMLTKEAALIRKKVLSSNSTFGKRTGNALRTIHGYKGANTMFESSRTLIRKDGNYGPEEGASSVPSWIGPQHYNLASDPKSWEHVGQYQLAFKSKPRSAPSKEAAKNAGTVRRRKQIEECKLRQSAQPASSVSIFENLGDSVSTTSLERLTAFSLASLDSDEASELDSLPKYQEHDDDGSGTVVSARSVRSRGHSVGRKNVGFQDGLLDNRGEVLITPRTPNCSVYSGLKPRSILTHPRPTTTETAARIVQAPVLNPIFTRKDFTMKMIRNEEAVQTRFFKVKDYTMDAFAGHPARVSYIDEFEAEDKEIVLDSSYGVYQHRTHTTYRKPPPIGTFTSDIFYVKPPEYVPAHKEKVETKEADASVETEGSNTSPGGGENVKKGLFGYKEKVSQEYHLTPLEADIDAERIRQERTVDKWLLRRMDSRKFKVFEPEVEEEDISFLGNPRMNRAAAVESNHSIEHWLRENNVIRANKEKRVGGVEFLAAHKPLPSIALSLEGLTLPHNPYTPDTPHLRSTFAKVEKDL
ncbi:hypothetical protein B484DRAFT_420922 [Ochromonadaceae sp. CCMP2298]|nr:hypothetical protein B484DRAFT_420922 [Ochromonadaceae sp. CCMP2298]|mmetsp:Transcript_18426/g.40982  ORF Transcript_18426/g.40982 Transcript_18426/m.40982 type:complete len:636 (+) Transcript_18426:203-2110(+)|eukprot:CAMPEP_0173366628 /NCGR_PEP_ID=MMETSP1144-20121109/24358_1 /TAXON_ID=483371 /ORGANISM="non described non described, Strain CCMP2298" /LENGTH=635 /DNA_ID=CAMNT_0014317333 /DNA_START=114 /DNA_END=2021 /DNA_ORIENTATION=+